MVEAVLILSFHYVRYRWNIIFVNCEVTKFEYFLGEGM